jgi:hypothetical protein
VAGSVSVSREPLPTTWVECRSTLSVATVPANYTTSQGDVMFKVFWTESGTGERCAAGPFKTREEAYAAPLTKLYPPIRNTIQVYEEKANV